MCALETGPHCLPPPSFQHIFLNSNNIMLTSYIQQNDKKASFRNDHSLADALWGYDAHKALWSGKDRNYLPETPIAPLQHVRQ